MAYQFWQGNCKQGCGEYLSTSHTHRCSGVNKCCYLHSARKRSTSARVELQSLTHHRTTNRCPPAFQPLRPLHTSAASSRLSSRTDAVAVLSEAQTEIADAADLESLQILEWPAICKQVACFCGTSVAADLAARGELPRGRNRQESELLLQQTSEAVAANLEVQGCFDIRPAVEAAAAGQCLNARQFEGVASTLEAAFALKARVTVPAAAEDPDSEEAAAAGPGPGSSIGPGTGAGADAGRGSSKGQGRGRSRGGAASRPRQRFPTLAALAEAISDEERTLLRAIRECIKLGNVSDEASEALAAVRAERQTNKERLRAEIETWVRQLQQRGAVEPGSGMALVRGRFCVGVRAGRQGELPRGSVRLGASSSGATLYMEPQPCVELNNREALLAEREAAEVQRVLGLLSQMLATRHSQLMALVAAFTALDVVAARGRHAVWMGGVRPAFVDLDREPDASPLFVPGALHPVLMQRGLPPLPQPPSVDDNRFDRDFQAAPAWEIRRVMRVEGPRSGELPPGAEGDEEGGAEGGGAGAGGLRSLMPRPLDLRVPPGRSVVAITGPNTGGKTVTLKAAGLMVLMAQAGLYLPCQQEAVQTHGSPRLAWFDRVLADIGDAQSLQQNLSTFSGHIRRIKQILAVAGGRSLVLLDEVGSGTDPLEGAALARAVLDRLAGQAYLTLATTHHAELKRASDEDSRYVNVSMAFDTVSLRPTYRLCWGAAGASNALDIAATLEFDRSVVAEARKIAQAMAEAAEAASSSASAAVPTSASSPSWSASSRESRLAGVARSLVAQLEETRQEVEAQRAQRARRREMKATVEDTIEQVKEMETQLKMTPKEIVMERDALAAEVQGALDAFAAGLQPQAPVEEALSKIEVLIPDQVAAFRRSGDHDAAVLAGEADPLKPGDAVYVPSYGDWGQGTVVSVAGDKVAVRLDGVAGPLAVKSKPIKFKRNKVQLQRGAPLPTPLTGWMSSYDNLASDIRKVLGQVSEQERLAAEKAAVRRDALKAMMSGTPGEAGGPEGWDPSLLEGLEEEVQDADADGGEGLEGDAAVTSWDQMLEEMQQEAVAAAAAAGMVTHGSQWEQQQQQSSPKGAKMKQQQQQQKLGGRKAAAAVAAAAAAATGKAAAARAGEAVAAVAAGSTAAGSDGAAAAGEEVVRVPPERTEANTLDVAGEVPELAAADLDDYLREAPAGSAFYVRHGLGTGAVRSAVYDLLARRRAPKGRVLEWREAPNSRGEMTVVWL